MKKLLTKKQDSLIDIVIVYFLFLFALFFDSLKTLFKLFTYGIFKKEILTSKSNLGFDLKIKIK